MHLDHLDQTADNDPTPASKRGVIDTSRAVVAAASILVTTVLIGLTLWIPDAHWSPARSAALANILTAAAAVSGFFALTQFSTGSAVQRLLNGQRVIRRATEANTAAVEAAAATHAAALDRIQASLNRIDVSLRWLASQFDHGVGELRSAAVDTTDTISIVSQTVAQVGDALAATQKVIAEGMTGLRQDIVGQRGGRGSGRRPRRGGGPPRQTQGGSTLKGSVPIDETFKAYLAGVRAREEGQHGEGPPPVA